MRERGYLIMAIDDHTDQYLRCAHALRSSLHQWHPDADVTIITNKDLKYPQQLGHANDWQAWYVSPYRETIKLEADMLITSPFDHWWTLFEKRDVVINQGARDWQGQAENSRRYRKFIDDNDLADVYNAITYWRRSETAREFFAVVRDIFERWSLYRGLVKFAEDEPSTDFVYAMAAEIVGRDRVTLPPGLGPQITHMKAGVTARVPNNWSQNLVWEYHDDGLRINTWQQWGAFHYQDKSWVQHVQP